MPVDWVKKHEEFLARLKDSRVPVLAVADYFCECGHDATVKAYRAAPAVEDRELFSDEGDLVIHKDGNSFLLEVKSVDQDFTCEDDWPFADFIVDGADRADRVIAAGQLPVCYYILSKNLRYAGLVMANSTVSKWRRSMKFNKKVGHDIEYMVIWKHEVSRWVDLVASKNRAQDDAQNGGVEHQGLG